MIAVVQMFRLTRVLYRSPLRVVGWASPSGLKREKIKDTMRRVPHQLALWTPRHLHLLQPGCQERADRVYERERQWMSELRPEQASKEPWWVARAYRDFWEGQEYP